MAKKQSKQSSGGGKKGITPEAAAMLAGVIYQSRLLNRQAKLNIPEEEIISDVINLWLRVMDRLSESQK